MRASSTGTLQARYSRNRPRPVSYLIGSIVLALRMILVFRTPVSALPSMWAIPHRAREGIKGSRGCQMNSLRGWLVAAVLALVAGCTTTTITPEYSKPPENKYDMAAVSEVTAADKLWDGLIPYFRRGFRDQLSKDKTFTSVSEDPPSAPVTASTLIISGTITEIDRGS